MCQAGTQHSQNQYLHLNEKAFICILENLPTFMGMVSSAVELSRIKFVFGMCLSWLMAAGETPRIRGETLDGV